MFMSVCVLVCVHACVCGSVHLSVCLYVILCVVNLLACLQLVQRADSTCSCGHTLPLLTAVFPHLLFLHFKKLDAGFDTDTAPAACRMNLMTKSSKRG